MKSCRRTQILKDYIQAILDTVCYGVILAAFPDSPSRKLFIFQDRANLQQLREAVA